MFRFMCKGGLVVAVLGCVAGLGWSGSVAADSSGYTAYDISPSGVSYAVANCIAPGLIGGSSSRVQVDVGMAPLNSGDYGTPYTWSVQIGAAGRATVNPGMALGVSGGYGNVLGIGKSASQAPVLVGAYGNISNNAVVWNSTASGAVAAPLYQPVPDAQNPLEQPWQVASYATGTNGTLVVGKSLNPDTTVGGAVVWNLSGGNVSPASPTDLIAGMSGYNENASQANAISGNRAVGLAGPTSGGMNAIVWNLNANGTLHDYVDLAQANALSDSGISKTTALAVNGDVAVGQEYDAHVRAMAWYGLGQGSNGGWFYLGNGSNLQASVANGVNAALGEIVGNGHALDGSMGSSKNEAVVWTLSGAESTWGSEYGSATPSFIELNQYLPATADGWGDSSALAIDAQGDIVGFADDPVNKTTHAMLWVPNNSTAPEPASLALLALGAGAVLIRRRK